jgi:hypothetical protein
VDALDPRFERDDALEGAFGTSLVLIVVFDEKGRMGPFGLLRQDCGRHGGIGAHQLLRPYMDTLTSRYSERKEAGLKSFGPASDLAKRAQSFRSRRNCRNREKRRSGPKGDQVHSLALALTASRKQANA